MMGNHLPMSGDLSSLSPSHGLQPQLPMVPSSHCTPPPPYPMDSSIARYPHSQDPALRTREGEGGGRGGEL